MTGFRRVLFRSRAEYYHERRKPQEGSPEFDAWLAEGEKIHNIAEVIIGKQRHGPVGTVQLHFEGSRTKFSDLIASDHLPSTDAPF